jgi:hypothetical protein
MDLAYASLRLAVECNDFTFSPTSIRVSCTCLILPDNVASRDIGTRPIDCDMGSDRHFDTVRNWLEECITNYENCPNQQTHPRQLEPLRSPRKELIDTFRFFAAMFSAMVPYGAVNSSLLIVKGRIKQLERVVSKYWKPNSLVIKTGLHVAPTRRYLDALEDGLSWKERSRHRYSPLKF